MATNQNTLFKSKRTLNSQFSLTDIEKEKSFLGINFLDKKEGIYRTQNLHIDKVMLRFNMTVSKMNKISLSNRTEIKQLILPEEIKVQ